MSLFTQTKGLHLGNCFCFVCLQQLKSFFIWQPVHSLAGSIAWTLVPLWTVESKWEGRWVRKWVFVWGMGLSHNDVSGLLPSGTDPFLFFFLCIILNCRLIFLGVTMIEITKHACPGTLLLWDISISLPHPLNSTLGVLLTKICVILALI